MTDRPALNVVVVAYGSTGLLDRCLESLGTSLQVLVIDNSSDEEVHKVAAEHGCRYIDPGVNSGFAAGVNRALTELGSSHGDVLLLNPDAQLSGEVALALQDLLRASGRERVACVAPCLRRDDGTAERVEWPFPSPVRAWLEAVGLGQVRSRRGFLIGAVLLLRDEAIEQIGGLDERFFLYSEETDWQRRATQAGWRSLKSETLVGTHTGAGTSTDSARREAMFHASGEQYIRKWHGAVGWQVYRAGVLLGAGARCIFPSKRDSNRDRFARYLRGPIRSAGFARGQS